ncbi:MAG: ACP S-malonyltransferase [Deltaproteobacteria bacterium]|jgi:acyl transferase domain-containing protein|nr:ACP S-malonyltransferase [Deltaproteobacteria bacterium]
MKVLLFPGLDALFVTSQMKRWLSYPYIQSAFQRASINLSEITQKEEDLCRFFLNTHRPHVADLDRSLIALTVLQVAIAEELLRVGHRWDLVQGCSHGDIARSVVCGSVTLKDAIQLLWAFSELRKLLPIGSTCTVRTIDGTPLTEMHLEWLATRRAPVSVWSDVHGTIGTDSENMQLICGQAASQGLKIKDMLPFPVHSPALLPVYDLLQKTASQWPVVDPHTPTFSSIWVKDMASADEIVGEALDCAIAPVRWKETLTHLYHEKGAREFINVGPSNTLTGWLLNGPHFSELKVIESWEALRAAD